MDQKTEQWKRAYKAYRRTMERTNIVANELDEFPLEEIEEYADPLAWEERVEINIMLSWGGPSDGFKLYRDADGTVSEGYYYFADWFTYDEFRLTETELRHVLAVYPVAGI
jgi:hypothetical protein